MLLDVESVVWMQFQGLAVATYTCEWQGIFYWMFAEKALHMLLKVSGFTFLYENYVTVSTYFYYYCLRMFICINLYN